MSCVQGCSVSMTSEIKTCTYSGQAEAVFKKGSNKKRFEPDGYQIVEEAVGHLTQKRREQGHDVSYDEARESA